MNDLMTLLAVAAGAGLGGMARAWLTLRLGGPLGTIAVNTAGAGAMGAAMMRLEPAAWAFAVTGFLGAFTTVSALALTVLLQLQADRAARGAAYLATTLALGLGAVALGAWGARP